MNLRWWLLQALGPVPGGVPAVARGGAARGRGGRHGLPGLLQARRAVALPQNVQGADAVPAHAPGAHRPQGPGASPLPSFPPLLPTPRRRNEGFFFGGSQRKGWIVVFSKLLRFSAWNNHLDVWWFKIR